jgi:hypothetical protein
MKRAFNFITFGGVMLAIGFVAGAFYQNARSGYKYRLLEEKDYSSPLGSVKWSCFTETVGFPFLDPEKTMITVENRTVYKAQRNFQEATPRAQHIKTSGNLIAWEDGEYRYHLTMESMTNSEPGAATNSHPPLHAQ